MDIRKLKVLKAVVDEYIMTGEPVSSKSVAKLRTISVSAATIRNEMAALEQLGLLEQPHTSAGRIPTYQGFKAYIDNIVTEGIPILAQDEKNYLDDILGIDKAATNEILIQSATSALAELTKCAAVVADLSPKFSMITKVEVIPTGKRLYIILLITSNGNIKNKVCRLEFDLDNDQLNFFSRYIEENLVDISLESLSEEMLDQLITALGAYMTALAPLMQSVYEMSHDLINEDVKVTGESNLLSYDELDKMEIIRFMEHKNEVVKFLDGSFSGIKVLFGDESKSFIIGNSSLIASRFQMDGKHAGTLGVIGPMRINYSKIIPYIDYITKRITGQISEDEIIRKDDNEGE